MLIPARKQGQSIVIGGNIKVKVVRVEGDQVKLGIEALRDVPVHREESQRDLDKGKPRSLHAVASGVS